MFEAAAAFAAGFKPGAYGGGVIMGERLLKC
jgi:hypothetical protein